MIKLGDFAYGFTNRQVRQHIVETFQIEKSALDGFEVIVAFESDDGYSASNWFLLRKSRKLFENHASHCSCYGFEGQWKPEPTTCAYLKSDKFSFCGCVCDSQLKEWIKKNL